MKHPCGKDLYEFEVKFTLKEEGITMKITANIILTVDPPAPTPLTLAPTEDLGQQGVALTAGEDLPITGGTLPYQVTNVTGTVPPGVTINQDGTISGTPTKAGSYPLTIDVEDSLG